MRRIFAFAYSALIRAVIATGGAITAYGMTGMFTTAGFEAPNIIVEIGVLAVALATSAMWFREHRLDGLWAALMFAIPYALYSWGSWPQAECPPDHPPITPSFSCAPVGTHAIGVVAPVLAVLAGGLFVRDVRALARGASGRGEAR